MVTVTAYKNLMLKKLDGTVPTFIWPMLVHQRKLKESYHYLISSIVGAHPPLSRILAVGTDGESNLSAAITVRTAHTLHSSHDTWYSREDERNRSAKAISKLVSWRCYGIILFSSCNSTCQKQWRIWWNAIIFVTRSAKTWHNSAFLEIDIFASVCFMYLKLCSVLISSQYCK